MTRTVRPQRSVPQDTRVEDSFELLILETDRRIENETFKSVEALHEEKNPLHHPKSYKHKPIESFFLKRTCAPRPDTPSVQHVECSMERCRQQPTIKQRNESKGKSWAIMKQHVWALHKLWRSQQNNRWKQHATITIRIGIRFYLLAKIGHAMQQIALLRRCFYPRRDVIKWQQT